MKSICHLIDFFSFGFVSFTFLNLALRTSINIKRYFKMIEFNKELVCYFSSVRFCGVIDGNSSLNCPWTKSNK